VDEKLERLISRHLDGELTPDEELELNRAIIRDPQAHQVLEDYKRIDSLSGAVLDHALTAPCDFDVDALAPAAVPLPKKAHSPVWWLIPSAIAAAFVVMILTQNPSPSGTVADGSRPAAIQENPGTLLPSPSTAEFGGSPVQQVSTGAAPMRRVRYDTVRDLTGVIGDDGRIYWFEVDRTRKVKRNPQNSNVQLIRGEF
jgi:anti-sigma factor RsiW